MSCYGVVLSVRMVCPLSNVLFPFVVCRQVWPRPERLPVSPGWLAFAEQYSLALSFGKSAKYITIFRTCAALKRFQRLRMTIRKERWVVVEEQRRVAYRPCKR